MAGLIMDERTVRKMYQMALDENQKLHDHLRNKDADIARLRTLLLDYAAGEKERELYDLRERVRELSAMVQDARECLEEE